MPPGPPAEPPPGPLPDPPPGPPPDPLPEPLPYSTADPPPERLLAGASRLRYLVGRHLLVGVTLRDEAGTIVRRQQFHGTVTEVVDGVVVLEHADGELLLPAEPEAFTPARPGTYRLLSGEEVRDPDYLSTWSVTPESP